MWIMYRDMRKDFDKMSKIAEAANLPNALRYVEGIRSWVTKVSRFWW